MKGFLAGLGFGAMIGVLAAPRSGRESRRELQRLANDISQRGGDAASRRASQLRDMARDGFDRASDLAQRGVEQARNLSGEKFSTESLRESARQVGSKLMDAARGGDASFLTIINEWPQERLIEIDGIGPVLAGKIIQGRPYDSAEDLVEEKILPPSAIDSLRKAS